MKKILLLALSFIFLSSCSSGSSSIGSIDLRVVIKEALKTDVAKKAVKEVAKEVAKEKAKEAVEEKAKEVVVEKAQETINDALENSEEEI